MCYPEIALALPSHFPNIEELQFDLCRLVLPSHLPDQQADEKDDQTGDRTIIEALISRLSACPRLKSLKIGIGALSPDFPSATNLPILSGCSLTLLSQYCPLLENLNIFVGEPSAIDASEITGPEFESFCSGAKRLKSLVLKLHPATASEELMRGALKSLGRWCGEMEVLRLRMACDVSALPQSQSPSPEYILFPKLTHLALARPSSPLSPTSFSSTISISPECEAQLVQSWALALLSHFPSLEVLEAWSDHLGSASSFLNGSLKYFLPREEALPTCWEFLSGCEQDLWGDSSSTSSDSKVIKPIVLIDDYTDVDNLQQDEGHFHIRRGWRDDQDEEEDEENVYGEFGGFVEEEGQSLVSESTLDWEAASYLNEYLIDSVQVSPVLTAQTDPMGFVAYVDEEEGEITPGKGLDFDFGPFLDKDAMGIRK